MQLAPLPSGFGRLPFHAALLAPILPASVMHGVAADDITAPVSLSPSDHQFREEIAHAGFRVFVEQDHPLTRPVGDRVRAEGTREWKSVTKLDWSCLPHSAGKYRLGRVLLREALFL